MGVQTQRRIRGLHTPFLFWSLTLKTRVALKVRGPFVQTLCIEKDLYMEAI